MSDKTSEIKTKDYAGGWITEKEGTEPPGFLKLAIPIIGASMVVYLVVYRNGEVSHSSRGPLVQAFNQATSTADGFVYLVAAMALVFAVVVALFALRKSH